MAPTRPKPARRRAGIREDDAILGVLGGFGLVYTVFAPHGFAHPLHWLVSGIGAFVGGAGVWLYVRREWLQARLRRLRRPAPATFAGRSSPSPPEQRERPRRADPRS